MNIAINIHHWKMIFPLNNCRFGRWSSYHPSFHVRISSFFSFLPWGETYEFLGFDGEDGGNCTTRSGCDGVYSEDTNTLRLVGEPNGGTTILVNDHIAMAGRNPHLSHRKYIASIKGSIFHCYVSLPECTSSWNYQVLKGGEAQTVPVRWGLVVEIYHYLQDVSTIAGFCQDLFHELY